MLGTTEYEALTQQHARLAVSNLGFPTGRDHAILAQAYALLALAAATAAAAVEVSHG